jgi:N-acetyl-anhydromuramyl-L-alanine amidase AmpD
MYAGFPIVYDYLPINKYNRPGTIITPKGLVIHWTGNILKGSDADNTISYFHQLAKGGRSASAHYSLDSTKIVQAIPENEMAYHVGAKKYKTQRFGSYPNRALIGIEVCVNMDADFKQTYALLVKFAAAVCKKYGFDPMVDMVRHYDVTGKDCPMMMTEYIHDENHVRSFVEESFLYVKQKYGDAEYRKRVTEGINFMKAGLVIDGKQGDALWNKLRQDVKNEMVKGGTINIPMPNVKPTLRQGANGSSVSELQKLLTQAGYPTNADGDFGPATYRAVVQFQKDHGLEADGVVGKATWAALTQAKPPSTKAQKVVEIMSRYFSDLPDKHWASDEIDALHEMKLKNGTPIFGGVEENGKLLAKADEPIKRGEMAAMLYRAIQYVSENDK